MKKKHTRTRRGKALRLAAWLVILILVSSALGVIRLLPQQALRRVCQQEGFGDAEIIHAEWGITPGQPKRIYLCQSGDYILMASANWSLLNGGWYGSGGTLLDKNNPDTSRSYSMSARDGIVSGCVVGFVPEGETVPELWLQFREWDRNPDGSQNDYGDPVVIRPQTVVSVKGGSCYLAQFRLPEPETEGIYTYPGVEFVY